MPQAPQLRLPQTMSSLPAYTQLIPLAELLPADVVRLRNAIIDAVVRQASNALNKPLDDLIVRDVQAYTDLSMEYGTASAGTAENWERDFTGTTVGWVQVNNSAAVVGNDRYIGIFGIRDTRFGFGATQQDATDVTVFNPPQCPVSLVRINSGGAIKCIWDVSCLSAYPNQPVALSPAAVILTPRSTLAISYYQKNFNSDTTAKSIPSYLQLVGITVEPRGRVISP